MEIRAEIHNNNNNNNSNNIIFVDTSDFDRLREIMDCYGNSDWLYGNSDWLFGINENNETVMIEVYENKIEIMTAQNNGWIRHNCYYYDGTSEEFFDSERIK